MRTLFLFVCLLLVGCSSELPELQSVPNVTGKILMPNGRALKTGTVILLPTERFDVAYRGMADIDKEGNFEINDVPLFAIKYKIFITGSGVSRAYIKRYIPEKYYDREDDDTDLFVDLNEKNENIILKMTK